MLVGIICLTILLLAFMSVFVYFVKIDAPEGAMVFMGVIIVLMLVFYFPFVMAATSVYDLSNNSTPKIQSEQKTNTNSK